MAYTTIKKPSDYFNTKLYTGNGSTNHSITGVGFQPDWTWIKSRDDAYNHFVFDAVRGAGKQIHPDLTNAESTNLNNLYSFDSDGFSLAQSGNDDVTNKNNSNFASWNWLANGAGSANTDGSISSTVSANTTSGFSIVSYTGTDAAATIGHGLGAKPNLILVKSRTDGSYNWVVYHSSLGAGYKMTLNSSSDKGSTSNWGNTEPTSSVFSVNPGGGETNNLSSNFIAYCFADVQGFSKMGSYTGNGNADGTFVYTGFSPAFVMVKATSVTGKNWQLNDNKRKTFNVNSTSLFPNLSNAESTDGMYIDMLSNGFKARETGTATNQNGVSYIYMAFAEEPLVGDNPATAR